MSTSAGRSAFQLIYELSPIVLTYGVATSLPGSMLPIVSLLETVNFADGILGSGSVDPETAFAHFQPAPGSTLVDQEVATYPFANQATAANAVIAQGLRVALDMICPAQTETTYATKLAILTALQATLKQHNAQGGTYTVATPSAVYTNCLLTNLRDVSTAETRQVQWAYRWEFYQPLLTLADAQQSYNSLMSKLAGGVTVQSPVSYSGLAPAVNVPPSLAAPALAPAASGLLASGVAGAIGTGAP